MKRSYMLSLTTLMLSTVFSPIISADDMHSDNKIKLYTRHFNSPTDGAFPPESGIKYDGDISLVIDGKLVIAKNNDRTNNQDFRDSYVEVDAALNYLEITSAEFNWMSAGKKYHCVANDLPLYVQAGDINTGTIIYYKCN